MWDQYIKRIKNIVNNLYFENSDLTEKDLQKSRTLSIFEGCSSRTIVTLTSGAFLAGLVKYLGVNDSISGIIVAIPTLSSIVMILTPIIFERMEKRKFLISFTAFISRLLLSFMFVVPFLIRGNKFSILFLVSTFFIANLLASLITPPAVNWVISITPESIRGKYFGRRESYVIAFVAIATLVMGKLFDLASKSNNQEMGFIFLFTIVFILTLVNFYFASRIKEPSAVISKLPLKVSELFTLPLKNSGFRKIIFLVVLWNVGFQLSAPLTLVYMVSGLNLNYTFITGTVMLAAVASVVSARVLGRLADKKSWLFLIGICVIFQATSQINWFFVNPSNALFLIPISQLLGGVAIGGVNISLSNIQYKYSPDERKTVYLGFSSAVGGLIGFVSALTGSVLIDAFSKQSFNVLGFNLGNMQILFGLSSFLLIGCGLYIYSFYKNSF